MLDGQQRRWLFKNAIVVAAIANVAINAGLAWFFTRSADQVPLWHVSLTETSTVTDTVGTLFFLPLFTCITSMGAVGRGLRDGAITPLAPGGIGHRWRAMGAAARRLPAGPVARGAAIGAACALALAPPTVLALHAVGFDHVDPADFVVFKTVFAVVLGAVITPLIAIWAMSDGVTAGGAAPSGPSPQPGPAVP